MTARPKIMGILNVTPDSFSDGGQHDALTDAVAHAQGMLGEGADVIDVGGESTRPGSQRVPVDEQIWRTADVVERVAALPGVMVSIDTTRADVAEAALDRGATMINDIAAGREDERMFELIAQRNANIVLMHMQRDPGTMQSDPQYDDVVGEIETFLLERAQAAQSAGVKRNKIWIDPGIGFGKTKAHNLALMANLKRFVDTGYPVLLGASRKRFMGAICTAPGAPGSAEPPAPGELVGATCATTVMGVLAGVAIFRVHDVAANRQAADVAAAIVGATG